MYLVPELDGDPGDLPEETTGTRTIGTPAADGKTQHSENTGDVSAIAAEEDALAAGRLGQNEDRDDVDAAPIPARQRRVGVRARTESMRRLSKTRLRIVREEYPPEENDDVVRPVTRADCVDGYRPCPFVGCRYHLYLDVHPATGSIKVNFPTLEPDEMRETCALDVADRGPASFEQIGALMNVTRERVRQMEAHAMEHAGRRAGPKGRDLMRSLIEEEGEG